jgi:hypothetical protein
MMLLSIQEWDPLSRVSGSLVKKGPSRKDEKLIYMYIAKAVSTHTPPPPPTPQATAGRETDCTQMTSYPCCIGEKCSQTIPLYNWWRHSPTQNQLTLFVMENGTTCAKFFTDDISLPFYFLFIFCFTDSSMAAMCSTTFLMDRQCCKNSQFLRVKSSISANLSRQR